MERLWHRQDDPDFEKKLEEVARLLQEPFDPATKHIVEEDPLAVPFEKEHHKGPVDLKGKPDRDPYVFEPRPLSLELDPANISAPYLLIDASGHVLFAGDDQAELALKLNGWLSNTNQQNHNVVGTAIYVEMKGFSEDKAAALETSLRIQQRQIDPSISVRILPHFADDPAPTEYLFVRGIKLETISPVKQSIKRETTVAALSPGKDSFMHPLYFNVQLPYRVIAVTIRIVAATRELVQEFVMLVKQFVGSDDFDQGQSLSELLNRVTRDLKKRHEGLTEEQLKVEMIHQFGNIRIAKRAPDTAFTWS
jgi:hypothetical protein